MELGFEVTRVDGWTILGVSGEVDVATAPSMREQLIALITAGDTRLIVDLSPVDFLDSTGLGVLVGALKRIRLAEGELSLVVPQERIAKLFDITGLSQVFTITATRDAALAG